MEVRIFSRSSPRDRGSLENKFILLCTAICGHMCEKKTFKVFAKFTTICACVCYFGTCKTTCVVLGHKNSCGKQPIQTVSPSWERPPIWDLKRKSMEVCEKGSQFLEPINIIIISISRSSTDLALFSPQATKKKPCKYKHHLKWVVFFAQNRLIIVICEHLL